VHRLIVYCLSPYCHHSAVIEVDAYDGAVPVKNFQSRMVCKHPARTADNVECFLRRPCRSTF
jgi:hypothetical protein